MNNIIENENIRPFDVDGTLVYYEPVASGLQETINIPDPLGGEIRAYVNKPMIRILKEEYSRGCYVIVWSRGGYNWAATVVKALGLEMFVHQIMTKPIVYMDDSAVDTWLQDRVFLPPGTKYKK